MNDSVRAGLAGPEVLAASGRWPMMVARLRVARMSWRKRQGRGREPAGGLPSREALAEIVHAVCGALFHAAGPARSARRKRRFYVGHTLDSALNALLAQVKLELNYQARPRRERPDLHQRAVHIVQDFAAALPWPARPARRRCDGGVSWRPAARSVDEVLLCYPASWPCCITAWPISYIRRRAPLLARMIAELAHAQTGIDIHPGARIGRGFLLITAPAW